MKPLQIAPVFATILVKILAFTATVHACGSGSACEIPGVNGGTYHIAEPKDKAQKIFVFFHGHNGSGAGVIRNRGLVKSLHQAGYLVVAPDGPEFNFSGRTTRGWAARPEGEEPRGKRDDIQFVEKVLTEVAKRHGMDPRETVVSGFSSGGSMAWYFGCYSKMPLRGVIAVAGGLRRPLPDARMGPSGALIDRLCPSGPRKLVHIHGFSDRQVPLEGRAIRSWHQGDVFEGLAIQRQTNQCRSRPDKIAVDDGFWCREWTKCGLNKAVKLCLHDGGHGLPRNWLSLGLEWLDNVE